MNNLKANLNNVRSRVDFACAKAGRQASEVSVVAVSKRHPAARIGDLYELGQRLFGENYVQEALAKQAELRDKNIEWHFIGPLQSNKTREVAQHFHWVQSADRVKTLRRLSDQRPSNLPALNVCIQVNIDTEEQKSGVLPEQVPEMAQYASRLKNLRLRGLMAIPRLAAPGRDVSESYRRMRALYDQLIGDGFQLDTLSMGMSADLEIAIIEGSTMVRVGTDLLGSRETLAG